LDCKCFSKTDAGSTWKAGEMPEEAMTDGGNKEVFGDVYEVNSRRAHLFGYVLIVGLALEIINAVIWYKGSETIAEVIAVLLIVGGVWGELFFGQKARLRGSCWR
jgi:hypothetical protein